MTLVNIPAFAGLNIMVAPQRMRDEEATVAVGCDFRSLDLRPFKGDRDSGMGTTYNFSGGASIFQWDDTHWLGVLGDKNFARSPTFYSDATTGQRVFVCDNAAPNGNDWDWVQEVKPTELVSAGGSFTNSYILSGTTKRLGVPKPAPTTTLTYEPKNGSVTGLAIYTDADATINIPTADASGIKTGDKINLDIPGFSPVSYTVRSLEPLSGYVKVTLKSTKRVWKEVKVATTKGSKAIVFNKAGHGFVGGEQVFLSHLRSNATTLPQPAKWPSGLNWDRVWVVDTVTSTNSFSVLYYDGTGSLVPLELTTNATDSEENKKKVALLAPTDSLFDDPTGVTISLTATAGTNVYQGAVTYALGDSTQTGSWETATDTIMERSYVVTFVNEYGDESEPSDPTKTITVAQGDPVTFSTLPTTAAAYSGELSGIAVSSYRTPTKVRIYRTDMTGTFRLLTTEVNDDKTITWAEAATGGFTFVDTYEDAELGEPLTTAGWQVPPKDLNGILVSPGGSLVGYKGRAVIGSVPYAPYAFPITNRVAFDYNVVGLVATSSGLVVVTEGMPALIIGDDPATWSIQKLEYPYGCVSRRSIVDMGEVAIYASADGLVAISGANVELLTKGVLTRAQWNAVYNPSQVKAAHVEGRYYAVTEVGGVKKAFMFDPQTRAFIDLTVDQAKYPMALYTRLDTDTLLILKSDGHVYEWNRGTEDVPYRWRSKYFQLTRPDIFGCAQILSPSLWDNHQVTARLLAWDGDIVKTIAVASNLTGAAFDNLGPAIDTQWESAPRRYPLLKNVNPFRLPVPDNRYTVYIVELEGTLPIGQISLAAVIDELKQV